MVWSILSQNLIRRPVMSFPDFVMSSLLDLDNKLDTDKFRCRSIIETPKGCRNKYNYDPDANLFKLGRLLPEGMMFPYDFGFIPSTLADDGDPVDILVLMDAPAHVGCLIDVRLIGVIEAKQTENGKTDKNSRLLGVAIHSHNHENLNSVRDMDKALLNQIETFFISYNRQRGKRFKITDIGGPKRAVKVLKQGIKAYKARP